MKQILLVSVLSFGSLSMGLIKAADTTPAECYGLGLTFGLGAAAKFCGLVNEGDVNDRGLGKCSRQFKRHAINGCKATFLDTIKEAYHSDSCDDFERLDGDKLRQRFLEEDICKL